MSGYIVVSAVFLLVVVVCSETGPTFELQPEDSIAYTTGSSFSVTLHCLTRSVTISVGWFKNDIIVGSAGLPQHTELANGSLVVTASDNGTSLEGWYYCTISNTEGSARSRNALVRAYRVFEVERPKTQVFDKDEAVILAQGVFDHPDRTSSALWTIECEGEMLTCPGSNCSFLYSFSVVGRLQLYHVIRITQQELQNSIPLCVSDSSVALTDVIELFEEHITFTSFTFPDRLVLPETAVVSVETGHTVTLYCMSNSLSTSYTWTKNGMTLDVTSDSRISYATNTAGNLKIHNVSVEDAGDYVCTFTTSQVGEKTRTRSIDLEVYRFPTARLNVSQVSDELDMTCFVSGTRPLGVQIFHDLSVVHEQTLTDITDNVHVVTSASSGVYQCIVSNEYGSEQSSQYVEVPVQTTTIVMTSTRTAGITSSLVMSESISPNGLSSVFSSTNIMSSVSHALSVSSYINPISSASPFISTHLPTRVSSVLQTSESKSSGVMTSSQMEAVAMSSSLTVGMVTGLFESTPSSMHMLTTTAATGMISQSNLQSSTEMSPAASTSKAAPVSSLSSSVPQVPSSSLAGSITSSASILQSSSPSTYTLPPSSLSTLPNASTSESVLQSVSTSPSVFNSPTALISPLVSVSLSSSISRLASTVPAASTTPAASTLPPAYTSPSASASPSTSTSQPSYASSSTATAPFASSSSSASTSLPPSAVPSTYTSPFASTSTSISPSVHTSPLESISPSLHTSPLESISPSVRTSSLHSISPSVHTSPLESISPSTSTSAMLSASTVQSPRTSSSVSISPSTSLSRPESTPASISTSLSTFTPAFTSLLASSAPSPSLTQPAYVLLIVSTSQKAMTSITSSRATTVPPGFVASPSSVILVAPSKQPVVSDDNEFPIAIVAGAAGGGLLLLLLLIIIIVCLCRHKKTKKAYAPYSKPAEEFVMEPSIPGRSSIVLINPTYQTSEKVIDGYSTLKDSDDSVAIEADVDGATDVGYATVVANPAVVVARNGKHYSVPRIPSVAADESGYAAGTETSHYDKLRPKSVPATTGGGEPAVTAEQGEDASGTKLKYAEKVEGTDDHHYLAGDNLYASTLPRTKKGSKDPANMETSVADGSGGTSQEELHYTAGDDVYAVSTKSSFRDNKHESNNPD